MPAGIMKTCWWPSLPHWLPVNWCLRHLYRKRWSRKTGYVRSYGAAGEGATGEPLSFELTGKAVDYLGNSALREIMGLQGGRFGGSHRTDQLGSGIVSSSSSRPFQYGDNLGLPVRRCAARPGAAWKTAG